MILYILTKPFYTDTTYFSSGKAAAIKKDLIKKIT